MKAAILVFLGGGLGSLLRYGISRWLNPPLFQSFPLGTLIANVLACFALGIVIGLADQRQWLSAQARLFWAVGFCGGFSTFSTFSGETIHLFQSGLGLSMLLYVVLSFVLCLAATLTGLYLVQSA